MYIENINGPADVKKLNIAQMTVLASEMRDALLTKLSRHGGHFGPNFGMVEATIALHYVFESPKDKFVFDVSHQSYPHKMLTGRKDAFLYEEHYDDVSGYSSPHESEHDHFTIGHTSTSVSLACGLAKGRDLKGEDGNVVAIIGDGSLSGGEALEALDYAAELDGNLIILVNDNDMSIAENHGGLYQNLRLLRETGGKAECNLFRAMGLDYRFVADGNDIASLIEAFKAVKDSTQPVVVHIVTQKNRAEDIIPISEEALDLIGYSPDKRGMVFKGLQRCWTQTYMKEWIRSAGITKNISFHSYRRTFATLQAAAGTDIRTIQSIMAHKSITTTQRYIKVVDANKREASKKITLMRKK